MRGPGEATGCFALESAMDELAYALNLDPVEFRVRNHADKDEERNLPWSSKYIKECYEMGAEAIGWNERKIQPRSHQDGDWFIGYGMGTGAFGAFRGVCAVKAILNAEGKLVLQCSVNDMGPGTATMMTAIASETMGISADKIVIEMGSTGLPPGPMQGGSTVTSTVGSAVVDVCNALKDQLTTLVTKNATFTNKQAEITSNDLQFSDNKISLKRDKGTEVPYGELIKQGGSPTVEVTKESKGEQQPYSSYSFSVHFVKLRVHMPTGKIKIDHVVSCADAGTIISLKTSESQMIGGAVGGIGMALMEDLFIDDRFGRPINNNLADYHVPVNADIPKVDVRFVNKKDPYTNPMGSKGLGEIALVGVAPAIANAVFNAIGKRIRSLPITADKILEA